MYLQKLNLQTALYKVETTLFPTACTKHANYALWRDDWLIFPWKHGSLQFTQVSLLFNCFHLRVIAPKTGGAYYRGCRRPEPDFDETRSRRSFWAKTKFETHLFEIRAHAQSAPGPPKSGIFDPLKKLFFGQIFFLSNRREMFAMGFLVVFIPEMSSLWNFWAILRLGRDPALEGPRKALGRQHFYTSRYHKNFSSQA